MDIVAANDAARQAHPFSRFSMSTDFPPNLNELYETFDDLEDWDERYEYILELGRELPPLDDQLRTDENKVHGCMSTVWMVINQAAEPDSQPQRIEIQADSDSQIVKGLIVILLTLFLRPTAGRRRSAGRQGSVYAARPGPATQPQSSQRTVRNGETNSRARRAVRRGGRVHSGAECIAGQSA